MPREPLIFLDANHVKGKHGPLLYFGGSNYLRLAGHPAVRRAMADALQENLPSSGASRATTGESEDCLNAEAALARHFGSDAAALAATGYLAPIAAVQALSAQITHVLLDDAAHPAVADAARLSRKRVIPFKHADLASLEKKLRGLPVRACPLIACEGLLGARGTITPVREYARILGKAGWLLIDDAHGAGTIGAKGAGTAASQGLASPNLITTLSLSKALGLQGGAVLGRFNVIQAIRTNSSAYVGNTAPLRVLTVGIQAAVNLLDRERWRTDRLQEKAQAFHGKIGALADLTHDPSSPVLAVAPQHKNQRKKLLSALAREKIYPCYIHYVGSEQGFFRFALSAEHTDEDLERLARALSNGLGSSSRRPHSGLSPKARGR